MEETREVTKKESEMETPTGKVATERTTVSDVPEEHRSFFQAWMFVYYILGVVEVLLGFRLVFKWLGANPASDFVSFIYSVTGFLLEPFSGIFPPASTTGVETQGVFEPATLIAMVVYAVLAWGLSGLIEVLSSARGGGEGS